MSGTNPIARDDLDRRLGRALKRIALRRPLPLAAPGEPSDEELLRYAEGQMEGAEKTTFEALLTTFPFSRERLEILAEALAETEAEALSDEASEQSRARLSPDSQPGYLARMVFRLATLGQGATQALHFLRGTHLPVALQAAALALRGPDATATTETLHQFEHVFGEHRALVHLEAVPARGAELRVELSHSGVPVADGRAALKREGQLVESVKLKNGAASFLDLEPARYEVELLEAGEGLGRLAVTILPA